MPTLSRLASIGLCLCLFACSEPPPLKLGFIGGLSSQNLDTGQSGLNGARLAVEQINRQGGINGRQVELLARDDAQNPAQAVLAAHELAAQHVEAVIGPFTSAMAAVVVPVLAEKNILAVSPTVTSMEFYGKDDNLIRIHRTTRDNAHDYARKLAERGQRRIAVAYDLRNRNYSESWLQEFRSGTAAHGGSLVAEISYVSNETTDFAQVIRRMLAQRPDSLFFISGALDVARFAREARRLAPSLPLAAAEWAATDRLLELGGEVVDGLLIVLSFNKEDDSAHYRAFRDAYFERFQRTPSFVTVAAHDATTVLLDGLKARRSNESLKTAVLRTSPHVGLQQEIVFDANGDTDRKIFFTEIRSGQYRQIP